MTLAAEGPVNPPGDSSYSVYIKGQANIREAVHRPESSGSQPIPGQMHTSAWPVTWEKVMFPRPTQRPAHLIQTGWEGYKRPLVMLLPPAYRYRGLLGDLPS